MSRSTSDDAALAAVIETERERTARQIDYLARDLDSVIDSVALSPPDDEHDPEGSTVAFERAQVTSLLAEARQHLAALDEAVVRLRRGSSDVCERCGGEIGRERLMARPATRRCVRCAASR